MADEGGAGGRSRRRADGRTWGARDALGRAREAGRSDAAVADAEALLRGAADEVLGAEGARELALHSAKDRTRADAVRVRLLEALTTLE